MDSCASAALRHQEQYSSPVEPRSPVVEVASVAAQAVREAHLLFVDLEGRVAPLAGHASESDFDNLPLEG
jgi:hypothetical protein